MLMYARTYKFTQDKLIIWAEKSTLYILLNITILITVISYKYSLIDCDVKNHRYLCEKQSIFTYF